MMEKNQILSYRMKPNYIVFRDSNQTLEEEVTKEIDKGFVNLMHQWDQYDMNNKCLLFDEWKVEKLDIRSNKNPLILRMIKDINFSCLQRLDINTNEIQSLEGVERLKLPVIQEFYANTNKLTSLRIFRRVHWPNLKNFYFNKNRIQEGKVLCQLKTCYLKDLNIQYDIYDVQQCSDCRWIVKLETENLKQVEMKSNRRINNRSFEMKAKQKYASIKINIYP